MSDGQGVDLSYEEAMRLREAQDAEQGEGVETAIRLTEIMAQVVGAYYAKLIEQGIPEQSAATMSAVYGNDIFNRLKI